MRITIEDIRHPLQRERISNTSKFVVIEEGDSKIKILIATTYRSFRNGDFNQRGDIVGLHTPDKNLYEASLAIGVDIALRNFMVVKNRYGRDSRGELIDSDVFLENMLRALCRQMIGSIKYTVSEFEVQHLMAYIVSVISQITDEPIFMVDGKWKTSRDIYLDKSLIIKRKQYKHNFIDARVSRS